MVSSVRIRVGIVCPTLARSLVYWLHHFAADIRRYCCYEHLIPWFHGGSAHPPAGLNYPRPGIRLFSTLKPPIQNLSMTFGILPRPAQSREAVLAYLQSEGIDTEELEDVELPIAVEVMQERLAFLLKIGLNKNAINSYPLMVTCSVKKNMVPVLEYLEQLGITRGELPRFLLKYPMVLQSSVAIDLMPVIDFLLGLDIKRKDMAKVLLRYPDVLGFRLEGTISTSVAYLIGLGVQIRCIGAMLTACPEILGMRVANAIKPRVDFLLDLGIPKSIMVTLLEMRPDLLVFSLEDAMKPAVETLLEAGVQQSTLSKVVTHFPDILAQALDKFVVQKRDWLMNSVKVASKDVPRIIENMP